MLATVGGKLFVVRLLFRSSFYATVAMRKILLILVIALFLYSPYGPSWGRFVVNMAIVLGIFGFLSKGLPKRRYHDEHEEYD